MSHGVNSPAAVARGRRAARAAVLLAILFCCFAWPCAADASFSTAPGWYWLNPLPVGNRAYIDVSMLGEEAWVAADAPFLLHSSDAGRTFQPLIPADGSGYFDLVDFVSSTTGFAFRQYSGVYRTLDGGQTWTLVQAISASTVNDLFALDATHAWAQASGGVDAGQYRTANGTTWAKTTPPDYLADVAFADANNGWAVADQYPVGGNNLATATSTIYKTTDGGATWNVWRTATNEELLCVAVPSASRVVFGGATLQPYDPFRGPAGQVPRVVVMTGSGTIFTNVTVPGAEADVEDLTFSDASRGWAALSNQSAVSSTDASAIATTANGADSWTTVRQPAMGALDCNSSGTVLAAGSPSYVYDGITKRGWSYDVLRATAGGAFQSTDYSTLERSQPVTDLCFADAGHGWALHAKSVSRTQNGGASWQTQQVLPENQPLGLNALAASPSGAVWVVGSSGTMSKSADGGASWTAVDPATSNSLVEVAFGDASVGWAVGGASLQRTTNGGQTWFPVSPDVRYSWDGVVALSSSVAFFTGRDSTASRDCIVRTTNGGSSFDPVLIAPASVDLKGIWFRDDRDGWAYGSRGALFHTTDGGVTWPAASLSSMFRDADLPAVTTTRVVFETATKGWAFCDLSIGGPVADWYLLATTDGGATWTDARASTGLQYSEELHAAASTGGRTWFGGMSGRLIADFNADTLPPVTSSSYDGKWTNQPVSLTLSAVDAGAGAAYSRYRYKTAPWAYGSALEIPAPSNHSNDGAWRLQYYSVDVLGQAEATKTQFVKIDTRVPTGAVVASSPDLVGNTYVGPDFTLRWSGLDWAPPVAVAAQTSVNGVDVVGDLAYVIDGTLLRIIDVSKPMSPSQLGSCELGGEPADVKVVGDFAYVAAGDAGLIVTYVADTGRPEVAGVARIDGAAAQVAVANRMAYVATAAGRVVLVDVRDPGAPGQIDAMDVRGAVDVAAEGDLLTIAADGVAATYNVGRPDRPEQLGKVDLKATPQAIAVSGRTVCVAAGATQYVIGLDGAGRPELAGDYTYAAYPCSDVAIDGVLLDFVWPSGVLALDATAPDWPVFAGAISMPVQPPVAIDAAGEYAYIADGTGGLQIMKALPIEAASYVLDVDGQVTGPDQTPEPDARTVTFTGVSEGAKQFRVQTRDQAGNWNAYVNLPFTVDATGPGMLGNADFQWHRTKTFTITTYDLLSGVASVDYRVDGGPWHAGDPVVGTTVVLTTGKRGGGSGERTVEARAVDRVGNVSQGPWRVWLDGRPPVTKDDAPKNPLDPWNPPASAVAVTVKFSASDAHSGVASTWYSLDGASFAQGTQVTVPAPANGSNDGRHWIGYYSIDNVGNVEQPHWVCVVIDVPGAPAAGKVVVPRTFAAAPSLLWLWRGQGRALKPAAR